MFLSYLIFLRNARAWRTHREAYLAKSSAAGITVKWVDELESEQASDKGGLVQTTLDTMAVRQVNVNWSKEGLLEHLVELVVREDLVSADSTIYFTK